MTAISISVRFVVAFIVIPVSDTHLLQMSAEWGYVFYGAFEDDELIACFAIENKDDSVYELHLFIFSSCDSAFGAVMPTDAPSWLIALPLITAYM